MKISTKPKPGGLLYFSNSKPALNSCCKNQEPTNMTLNLPWRGIAIMWWAAWYMSVHAVQCTSAEEWWNITKWQTKEINGCEGRREKLFVELLYTWSKTILVCLFVCLFSSDLFSLILFSSCVCFHLSISTLDWKLVLKLELFVSKEGCGELNSDPAPTKAGKILHSPHPKNVVFCCAKQFAS